MKLTTYARTLHALGILKETGVGEVILEHRSFARYGKLTTEEFTTLATRARELDLRVLMEWDILMTEDIFSGLTRELPGLLPHCDGLRVQDPGAFEWALKHTDKKLQFIAENGNHNLEGLRAWIDYAEGRLERLVLSIELPKAAIEEYVSQLPVPCELLGFGRILLFYTPRSLLSPLSGEKILVNQELAAIGESEESPHKGFPILENRHGTFMFHIKEFCLLEYVRELRAAGLSFLRLDTRFGDAATLPTLVDLAVDFEEEKFKAFKETYPQDLMRGFYLVNKTDVLFPKLKNHRLQKREGSYLGEVMDAEKGSHLAILVKSPTGLSKTDQLRILHPKGEEFLIKIHGLRNLDLEEVERIEGQCLALIPYVNGVWVKSQVFFNN